MNSSERIDELIARLMDWRGKTFASIRQSILEADREIIEEWKWMGSPVWSHDGMIAVANAHKDQVELTFSQRLPTRKPRNDSRHPVHEHRLYRVREPREYECLLGHRPSPADLLQSARNVVGS